MSIFGRETLLWPGFVSKKHSRLLLSLMSWEYLALGVLQPHSTTQNTVSGPHAVLVVDEHENRPETRRTQFPALPLNFPPFARPYDFVAPRWATKHRANSPELMTCRHLEYGVHADASCLVSQQDQKPCLNQAECKRARVGGSRGKGQHGESEGATTSSQMDE